MDVLQPRRPQRPARHLQRRRRRGADAVPGAAPAEAADRPDAGLRGGRRRLGAAPGAARGLLSGTARLPHLRSRRGHHPDARVLGFEPAFTTAEAFADFAAGLTPTGGRIERVLAAALDQLPPVDEPRALRPVGRRSVGDAEIIPIGTRGRPGRGQGSGKPSSASRSLAAGARKAAPEEGPARRRAADGAADADETTRRARRAAAEAEPPEPTRAPAYTEERLPGRHPGRRLAGRLPARRPRALRRPVGAAAGPLPRLPAPPGDRRLRRRRVRLRPGDHRAVLHDRAAPDRAEVVPHRGPRHREHPHRGRRAGGVQPLRHASRSTG